MLEWKESDLHIVNPTDAIRRDAARFGLGERRGEALVCRLVADAVFSGATHVEACRVRDWRIVQAREDWVLVAGRFTHPEIATGLTTKALFQRIIEFPSQGRFHPRAEVLVNALAEAVVTSGSDGVTWISGENQCQTLPAGLKLSPLPEGFGRLIAFKLSDD